MINESVFEKTKKGRPKKSINTLPHVQDKRPIALRALACMSKNMDDPIQAYRMCGSKQLASIQLPKEAFRVLLSKKQIYFYGVLDPGDLVFFERMSKVSVLKMVHHFNKLTGELFVVSEDGYIEAKNWYAFAKVLE